MRNQFYLISALLAWSFLPLRLYGQAAPAPAAGAPSRFVTGSADPAASMRSKRQAQVGIDPDTKSLIITTDPTTNEQVQAVLKALDQPVPQALIKVLFLEVTHTKGDDLGVDLAYTKTTAGGNSKTISSVFGPFPNEPNFGTISVLQDDLTVTLRALATVDKLNVLSRPSILARNNQQATITIGSEVPFITNSRISDTNQTINTIEYQDIGIILTVTPHIGQNGQIELDVSPQITNLSSVTVPISNTVNAPVIDKRSAETHVVVPSGKTIVIGGLMEDQDKESVRKVPLLGDIWLLGALFRRTVKTKTKTELLIFLTPTVVESSPGLVAVSDHEQQQAKLIQQETSAKQMQQFLDAPKTETAK